MKTGRLLLAIAIVALSLHAADEQTITIKSKSIENSTLMVNADLGGKPTELQCQIRLPSCSQPQPGDYTMRPATADESVYEDCTNVVLLKPSAPKEKIGVYCRLTDDHCYIISCQHLEVATTTSDLPSVIVSPEIVSLPIGGGPMPSPAVPSRPAATKSRSWQCLYLWKCSSHNL